MILVLTSVVTLFSFRTYYIPFESLAGITNHDTVAPEMDTIVTLDLETYTETVKIIKKKKNLNPADELKIIQENPETITFYDTLIILDPNTYEEKVRIESTKMAKGYKILIDIEYKKPNPDFKKIEKWRSEGKRD
jgi:hypothetical protein